MRVTDQALRALVLANVFAMHHRRSLLRTGSRWLVHGFPSRRPRMSSIEPSGTRVCPVVIGRRPPTSCSLPLARATAPWRRCCAPRAPSRRRFVWPCAKATTMPAVRRRASAMFERSWRRWAPEVRVQSEISRDRCYRLGRRAWIVMGEATENHQERSRFVLWHEVAHLARRDVTTRRLSASVQCSLFVAALASFDPRAVAITVAGTAVLAIAGRWWSELACDRFAVKQAGVGAQHDRAAIA
jgi:hypothetical protein